jgi:hypothetical protein
MIMVQTSNPKIDLSLMGGGRGETGYWTSSVQALRLDTARTMLSTDPDRVMYVAGTTSAGLVTGNEGRP